jgi:short-subunit dehydrogenase
MKKKRKGHIIYISSIAGKIPIKNASVYCGTKFGIYGFGSSLTKELKDNGIKICTILPGGINTPLWKKINYKPGILKDALQPKDIFKIIELFLNFGKNVNFNEAILMPTIENF